MADQESDFTDIEISILPKQTGGYPVELTLDSQQVFRGQMPAELDSNRLAASPEKVGDYLFESLMSSPELLYGWAQGRTKNSRVRLNIHPDAAGLHSLPWELLHYRGDWVAASPGTPFSRYLSIPAAWGEPSTARPIRLLVVISNPTDLDFHDLPAVDAAAEKRAIESGLADLGETVEVEYLDQNVTLPALEDQLRPGFQILHFIGHGKYNRSRTQAALLLQREDGSALLTPDERIVQMLRSLALKPALVFLSACQSAARSTENAFVGLAPRLVQAGLPAVIAMQGPLNMNSSLRLNKVFYQQLAEHGQVDLALNQARAALLTAMRPDFDTPVLFMRLKNGQLWREGAPQPPGIPASPPPGIQQTTNISTGGGAYIGGNISVQGDFVGRDKIVHESKYDNRQSDSQADIAEGGKTGVRDIGGSSALQVAFASLKLAAHTISEPGRSDLLQALASLEEEAQKGASADEKRIRRAFFNLADTSPEVWQSTVAALAGPVEGLSPLVQKVALEEKRKG